MLSRNYKQSRKSAEEKLNSINKSKLQVYESFSKSNELKKEISKNADEMIKNLTEEIRSQEKKLHSEVDEYRYSDFTRFISPMETSQKNIESALDQGTPFAKRVENTLKLCDTREMINTSSQLVDQLDEFTRAFDAEDEKRDLIFEMKFEKASMKTGEELLGKVTTPGADVEEGLTAAFPELSLQAGPQFLDATTATNLTLPTAGRRHRFSGRSGTGGGFWPNLTNLYINNLEPSIDDVRLCKEFSRFGTIASSKVMLDYFGRPRGFGFVRFSTPDEASKAITEMNGRVLISKPLYVTLSRDKSRQDDIFSQLRRDIRESYGSRYDAQCRYDAEDDEDPWFDLVSDYIDPDEPQGW